MKTILRASLVALVCVGALGQVSAASQLPPDVPTQAPRGGRANPPPPGVATNAEVQQMLDAFVMQQAQVQLQMQIGDPQFVEFFRRMTHYQDVQRRHRNQRQRVLMELRRLVAPARQGQTDEAAIPARIKELDDLEAQFQQEERQALIAIDTVLQPFQRGRFRVFLEQMEQRKLELLVRARQGGPGRGQQPPAGQAPIR